RLRLLLLLLRSLQMHNHHPTLTPLTSIQQSLQLHRVSSLSLAFRLEHSIDDDDGDDDDQQLFFLIDVPDSFSYFYLLTDSSQPLLFINMFAQLFSFF